MQGNSYFLLYYAVFNNHLAKEKMKNNKISED